MFIQTEATPNPLTLKFVPDGQVMPSGTAFYTTPDAASASPLAQALFEADGVTAVFLTTEFITITRSEAQDWDVLKPQLLNIIMDHFVAGKPVIGTAAAKKTPSSEDDSEIVKQIKELIDTRVRPAVAMDGGDIIFHSFEDGVVQLEMHGACSGCPSASATLKQGIENMLKHYVPEVVAVEPVN